MASCVVLGREAFEDRHSNAAENDNLVKKTKKLQIMLFLYSKI